VKQLLRFFHNCKKINISIILSSVLTENTHSLLFFGSKILIDACHILYYNEKVDTKTKEINYLGGSYD